jgi:hypothetical protein
MASSRQFRKSFLYPGFANRPNQKSNGLNPGDSANSDTTNTLAIPARQP